MGTKTRKNLETDDTKELFISLQTPQKAAIRQKLLECLHSETQTLVKHKIADAVAEVARQYAESGQYLYSWRKNRSGRYYAKV